MVYKKVNFNAMNSRDLSFLGQGWQKACLRSKLYLLVSWLVIHTDRWVCWATSVHGDW